MGDNFQFMCKILSRIEELSKHEGITIGALEKKIGASKGVLSRAIAKGTDIQAKWIELLVENYPNYSTEWLLTGNGPMLKSVAQEHQTVTQEEISSGAENLPEAFRCINPQHPAQDSIPLVTPKVAAGFGTADFAIAESDVKEYYVIPKWRRQHVDFMIEVTGDSMQPKYNAGDIVGCTIIHNSTFIQWNRPHVIATREQGLLVKRLMPGTTPKTISAVSDNPKYPPFDIPKEEINGIALVIGMVGLE
ncbi:S24 family peptidase [Segatella buccae]|uniref:S24 family peptidase n=1 Tax=Segatella buccae TaxID=28126 RepID=UPI0022E46F1B|nr:S24 family peptidase [Segatella buccae]